MKMSKLYAPTLREVPSEAELISHQLLLRAGMIRMLAAGIYTYLPLGLKVIQNIERIIREEMAAIDSQETLMSVLTPAELWQESGRWDAFGPEMFRLQDRHQRQFCLGPTHEEVFTHLVRHEVKSYKQLPLSLYQIQTKFRDEKRPRFGLMRGREFIMKDAYTFDRDVAGMKAAYQAMWEAYERIFNRCGLNFRIVEGDAGAMGGSDSHEFIALSPIGETEIIYCEACSYAATAEKAACSYKALENGHSETATAISGEQSRLVHTPQIKTIEDLEAFFGSHGSKFAKTLLFTVDTQFSQLQDQQSQTQQSQAQQSQTQQSQNHQVIAVMVPGHRNLNLVKLANYLGLPEHALEMATPEVVQQVTGAEVGFAGPIGFQGPDSLQADVRLLADRRVAEAQTLIVGANKTDYHLVGVRHGIDFTAELVDDLLQATEGDLCPSCGHRLSKDRGNEVGNIFQLGTKYSEALGARYLDEQGKDQLMVMGSHGIGVTRTLAAVIEQHHDEMGIVWPAALAPYQVVVMPINRKDPDQWALAEQLYTALQGAGIEVLLDDRQERAGVKFKDAELLGIPLQVVVGKGAQEGRVELKYRSAAAAVAQQTANQTANLTADQTGNQDTILLEWTEALSRCQALCRGAR